MDPEDPDNDPEHSQTLTDKKSFQTYHENFIKICP